ncbi:E3 ubiquitin-protein ligase RNF4 [Pseudolycoriella hygida]|uniref:E3 ubiquitin-protein ligase RNF4 n=1 Tax=Pseudolycoriella hygida TaxID=35572 RepID=A0A9Q0MV19_9DIPT|nr:E3 ubiquitin-protein ligase RNF4 [Pseudolycoriella hygida]
MDEIVLLDDSIPQPNVNSSNVVTETEEESVEQLIQRATEVSLNARTFMAEKTQRVPTMSTIRIAELPRPEPIQPQPLPVNIIESDDEVIFVGEVNPVINLCSPDVSRESSRIFKNSSQKIGSTASNKSDSSRASGPSKDPMENTVICAVCMESSVGRHPHSTTCGHIFCGVCIKTAIKVRGKCPLCNKHLNVKGIIPIFI